MTAVMKMTYAEFWMKVIEASPRMTIPEIAETCYNWGAGTEAERMAILAMLAKLAAPLRADNSDKR